MDQDNNNTPPDFQGALAEEFGLTPEQMGGEPTPPVATPPTPPADPVADPNTPPAPADPVDPNAPPVPPAGSEEAPKPADGKQETPEEEAQRKAEEAANAEPPTPLTREDIQAAIRAERQQTEGRVDKVHTAREEIISVLHPTGIDKNIYDTDGKVIKTAQDIVDRGLINDRTGEAFTYDEAASFVLEANKKIADNVEELNSWAEQVAEQNISLLEGNERVISQWGDILQAMPQLADELAKEYITTQLEFDKTGSYIVRMGMTPENYYNRVLAPYKRLGETLSAQNAAKAEEDAKATAAAQQAEQDERNGIPPQRGTSDVKSNTGDPMLDALVDELNKG